MKRRDFITLLGGAAAWPLAASAQQPTLTVIGYVGNGSRETDAFRLPSFRQGLSEGGYVEGRNVTIEYRWAEDHNDRLPAIMAELVRREVTVIAVPASTPGALAAKAATSTIPIVFYIGLDPVELELVASLHHPGANITGVTGWNVAVGPKRLELLHEVVPKATMIGLLVNPTSPDLAGADSREQQSGGPDTRPKTRCPARQHRTRLGFRLFNFGRATHRWSCDRHRFILQHSKRTDSCVKRASSGTYHPSVSGVCGGWRPDELRNGNVGPFASGRDLHRQDFKRRKAG